MHKLIKMRLFFLIVSLFVTQLVSAQGGMPDWLEPDSLGRDVYVQGMVSLKQDTTKTSCRVTIIRTGADSVVYNINVGQEGFYEFFLHPDNFYHVFFKKDGYATKKLDIDTHNIPEKVWKRGFAMVVDIEMEQVPPSFDRKLFEVPVGICRYFEKGKELRFDPEYTKAQRAAWDAEIAEGTTKNP
jgi:hypothetical protein